MVVTSAIFWLLFAICIVVICNTNYSISAKMTYGLVYRPLSQQAAASSAEQVAVRTSTEQSSEPTTHYIANETQISAQTEQAPAAKVVNGSSTSLITNLNLQNVSDIKVTGNLKYSQKEIPAWMIQNGVVQHQYQVHENDSDAEAEGSDHRFKTIKYHKTDGELGKKESTGSSGDKIKEKKTSKKGENTYKKSGGGKKKSKHGGKKSSSKKEGAFKKHGSKSKKGSHKSSKKKDDYSSKKGYNNKYKMNKEDKVHEFWSDHHENGEFVVYGEKKKSVHDSKKGAKKHKWKKKSKKAKKKKKKGKKSRKEKEEGEKGYKEKKGTKHFYHNEKKYGHEKKSGLKDDQKKS